MKLNELTTNPPPFELLEAASILLLCDEQDAIDHAVAYAIATQTVRNASGYGSGPTIQKAGRIYLSAFNQIASD